MSKRYIVKDCDTIKEINNDVEIVLGEKYKSQIKEICRKLNGGSGFNGFTPTFFAPAYIKEGE